MDVWSCIKSGFFGQEKTISWSPDSDFTKITVSIRAEVYVTYFSSVVDNVFKIALFTIVGNGVIMYLLLRNVKVLTNNGAFNPKKKNSVDVLS